VKQPEHAPIILLAHVRAAAAVRLPPFADAILNPRRVFADSAIKDSAEQNCGITHAILGITGKPPKDISGLVGRRFQGGARFLSAWLILTRPSGTGAFAAVLTKGNHTEGIEAVRHRRYENRGRVRFTLGPEGMQGLHGLAFSPPD
jgi:hypothetical protein